MKRRRNAEEWPNSRLPVAGVIVAGGRSLRMGGGDKCLLPIGGRSMLAHVIDRFAPQVDTLAVNANGDPSRFASFGLPVIGDVFEEFVGPLAGLLTGMRWAEHSQGTSTIATVPGDTPFIPADLLTRLLADLGQAEMAIARSRGELHPIIGLWRVSLADDLAQWLHDQPKRGVKQWIKTRQYAVIDFDDCGPEPFLNVNTPEDLRVASCRARQYPQVSTASPIAGDALLR